MMPRLLPEDPGRLQSLAATASLAVAVSLATLKLLAAILTGSLALLSSTIDSLTDILASGVTYLSVRVARQPPDRSHRFGHGKAEALSALAQAALVLGAALFVLVEGVQRLIAPPTLRASGFGMLVMLLAILVTALLLALQRHVVARTGSQAIAADAVHYRADFLTNFATLLSLFLVGEFGWSWPDPVIAALIAAYLAFHAVRIGRQAVDVLMDRELPTAVRARILELVRAEPEVRGVHDLRTRRAGRTMFVEMHVEFDPELTVRAAHDIADALERRLEAAFPGAEILIHQEPAGIEDHRLDHVIAGRRDLPGPT